MTIGVEGLTPQIQNRRQSCPEELLKVPLTKGEKTILRKHGLGYQHKRARKSFNMDLLQIATESHISVEKYTNNE